jgi:hypothetical protein
MWSSATPHYGATLLPTKAELQTAVNETLDRAGVFGMRTTLWAIPLCLLSPEHLCQYALRSCRTSTGLSAPPLSCHSTAYKVRYKNYTKLDRYMP